MNYSEVEEKLKEVSNMVSSIADGTVFSFQEVLSAVRFVATEMLTTKAVFGPKGAISFFIEYDLCPDCKALFLDFMEGEAIPPCKKTKT